MKCVPSDCKLGFSVKSEHSLKHCWGFPCTSRGQSIEIAIWLKILLLSYRNICDTWFVIFSLLPKDKGQHWPNRCNLSHPLNAKGPAGPFLTSSVMFDFLMLAAHLIPWKRLMHFLALLSVCFFPSVRWNSLMKQQYLRLRSSSQTPPIWQQPLLPSCWIHPQPEALVFSFYGAVQHPPT